jgi:putative aldouronate transport system substrate-binding protein
MKKLLLMTIAGTMILAGCAQNTPDGTGSTGGSADGAGSAANQPQENLQQTGYPIVNEPITLKMMGPKAAIHAEWKDMNFFKYMEEKTNIHFEFDTPPASGYADKKNLVFASMELPDVFFSAGLTALEEVNYGSQGILVPLEDLIDQYAPNLKAIMDKRPEIRKSITTPDGHIYALPMIFDAPRAQVNPMLWINGKWLDKLKVTTLPKTTDELVDLLIRFKKEDPNDNGKADEIPVSATDLMTLRHNFLPAFGLVEEQGFYVEDDKVSYALMEDGFREYLRFMNRLYTEKLLDQEVMTHTAQEFNAKGAEVGYGMFPYALPSIPLGQTNVEEIINNRVLPPLTSPFNDTPLAKKNNTITRGTFAITNKNKHPEATMRWVDYLYSEEGAYTIFQGVEGENWEWVDAEKTRWVFLGSEQERGQATPDPGTAPPQHRREDIILKKNAEDERYFDRQPQLLEPYLKSPFPTVYFTPEEQTRVSALQTDIETYYKQMEAQFIVGRASFDKWEEYVSTLKRMGIEDLIALYQAAYDRWNQ